MPVEISLAKASVRIAGEDVPMSGHTLALALFLAAEGRPVSRERLSAALFPAHSANSEGAVKVYVHRLRAVIGKTAIVRRADGYVYNSFVRIDLPEMEAFVAYAIDDATPSPAMRARARNLLSELAAGRPDAVLRWTWFAHVERRLRLLERRLHGLCAEV